MCGIAFVRKFDGTNANKQIKSIYFSQKERGVNGYGFYNVDKAIYRRSKYEHDILGELHKNPGNEILFHHRKPTSTSNTENTAHPLCSKDNFKKHNYYMVHNGMIYNSKELYRKHTDAKLTYSSICGIGKFDEPIFNDSESLMLELALIIEGKKLAKDFGAYGSIAFIMIQTDKENKPLNLYFGRNEGSPLKIKGNKTKLVIASDIVGDEVTPNKLNKISYTTNEMTSELMDFPRHDKSYNVNDLYTGGRDLMGHNSHQRSLIESPGTRADFMKELDAIDDQMYADGMGDEQDITKKKDGDLYLLQEGLMGDVSTTEGELMGSHDPAERERLRGEMKEIKIALKKVDDEIDRRIKINDGIPVV